MKYILVAVGAMLLLAGCTTMKPVAELVPDGALAPVATPPGSLPHVTVSGSVPEVCTARDSRIADVVGALYRRVTEYDRALNAANMKLHAAGTVLVKVPKR